MKDAKGHGSDPRGAHSQGVDQIGRLAGHSYSRPKIVSIDQVHLVGHTLNWNVQDHAAVNSYRQQIRSGEKLAPVIVDRNQNIIDGTHRYAAFKAEGKTKISVVVES